MRYGEVLLWFFIPNDSCLRLVKDAAAAALFTACKIEDTLKKSRDILCAAYNLKAPPSDQLSADDPVCYLSQAILSGLAHSSFSDVRIQFPWRHRTREAHARIVRVRLSQPSPAEDTRQINEVLRSVEGVKDHQYSLHDELGSIPDICTTQAD